MVFRPSLPSRIIEGMMNVSDSFNHLIEVDMTMSENVDRRIESPDLTIQRQGAGHQRQPFKTEPFHGRQQLASRQEMRKGDHRAVILLDPRFIEAEKVFRDRSHPDRPFAEIKIGPSLQR